MEKVIVTNITNIGDPVILLENGVYYMYATYSGATKFHVYTSTDSKHFEDAGVCLSEKDTFAYECVWAPEVIKYNNKYYMFYSGRSFEDKLMHLQVAISDSPLGPFKDVSSEPLLKLNDKSTIDAHPFIDEDGKAYMFFSMDCSTNIIDGKHISQIYAIRLSKDLTKTEGEMVFISSPSKEFELYSGPEWFWNEGPYVLKNKGRYFLTYSTNFYASKYYSVGCLVADNPMGPYVLQEEKANLAYVENEMSGPGHNAFFVDKDGTLKCVFHIHSDYNHPSGDRQACICPAYFDENNNLVIDYK